MKQTLQTLKKVFAAAMLAVLLSFQVKAETPAITLVTENPDTTLILQLAAGISKTTIQIDWGKGTKTSYSVDTSLTVIRNPSVQSGQTTISVYGSAITAFSCVNNRVSGLDVKNCTSLKRLYCSKNQIQTLDITANVNLTTLDCRYNLFTFSTLPLPRSSLKNYIYAPQQPASVKKTLRAGDQIDLSSYLSVADGTGALYNTLYTWKNGVGATLVQGTDYTVSAPGIFTFSTKPGHIVYCEMTNDLFPAFIGANVYCTSAVTPEGFSLPLAFTATSAGVSKVSIGLSAMTSGMPVKIVWGNGNTVNTELDFLETEFETIKTPGSSINISVYGEGIKSINAPGCGFTTVDLTKCTLLDSLILDDNLFSIVNVSRNAKLRYLSLYDNVLDEIDVSNNPLLTTLDCSRCWLYDLDISGNPLLEKLYCNSNNLNFGTLPTPRQSFKEYVYAPQNFTYQYEFPDDRICDLTEYYSATDINGQNCITRYKWKYGCRPYEEGVDYVDLWGGYFVLYTIPQNLIYCEMTNAAFPDLSGVDALKYGYRVKPAVTIKTESMQEFYFYFNSVNDTNLVVVDYGSGGYYSNTIRWLYVPARSKASEIKIYAEDLTYFYLSEEENVRSLTLDFSNSKKLNEVYCVGNVNLDTLIFSGSSTLDTVSCYRNSLRKLDVSNLPSLKNLNCGGNDLSSLDVTHNTALTDLLCLDNRLTSLNVSNNIALTSLSVRTNQIGSLDISRNTALTFLSCRDNRLKSLDVSKNTKLDELYCFGNLLTIGNLPQPSKKYSTYQYAPQSDYTIPKTIESYTICDLSSQLTAKDSNDVSQTTIYIWKTSAGKALVKDTDYLEKEPGKFEFISNLADSIYCEMTNQAFPGFSGQNIFKTNRAKVHYTAPVLLVSEHSLQLEKEEGSSQLINVTSNMLWTAVSNQVWLTVSPSSGSNNGTITLTAGANTTPAIRTATVTVSADGVSPQVITISQNSDLDTILTVSSNVVSINKEASSTATVTVNSNTSWSVSSDQAWLTVSPASGANNGTITFMATANGASSERIAIVTISGTGVSSQNITVTQKAAADNARLAVSQNSVSIGKEANSATIAVTSNISWTVTSDQAWLSVSPSSGINDGTITLTVLANTSSTIRMGNVRVSGQGVDPQIITVTQAPATILLVSSDIVSLNAAENSTASVVVTSNTTWTVSSGQEWLKVSPAFGSNNGTITFTATANTTSSDRTATVTLSGEGVTSKTITVTQAAVSATTFLSVSQNTVSIARDANSTASVTVTSNTTWSVSSDQTWLSVSPATGSNDGTITFTAQANITTRTRTATVTVSGQGVSPQIITVTQAAAVIFTVSQTNVLIEWKANSTSSVVVASNTTWTVSSDQPWLSVSPAEGANNGKITLTATENSSFSNRTAIVMVMGEGARTQTITVTQKAAMLAVSLSAISLKKDVNSYAVFSVISNTSWTISSDQPWLTITPNSGADNGMITLSATANTTSESRTATVTVSGVNVIPQTITVTQAAGTNGVADFHCDEIQLYPNPVTDRFRIAGIIGNATIVVSDLNGKIRLTCEISGDETISAGSLAKGLYLLTVKTDGRIIERKLIKE